jgi:hypothetical protein
MARKGSFEERARAEVERIKEVRIAEEVRKHERLRLPKRGSGKPSGTPSSGALGRRRPKPRRSAPNVLPSIAG